jgi:hypothetical protein
MGSGVRQASCEASYKLSDSGQVTAPLWSLASPSGKIFCLVGLLGRLSARIHVTARSTMGSQEIGSYEFYSIVII